MRSGVWQIVVVLPLSLLLNAFIACSGTNEQYDPVTYPKDDQFNDYWYQGKAELTRFQLNQVRYGEVRSGNAVLVFVTEDFFTDKQVKYEFGLKGDNVQSVLKLNFMRRFYTGVYPYSVMTSVFYPVHDVQRYALKVSATVQEWCGHAFMQLNNRTDKFDLTLRSYFQKEGDQNFEIDKSMLEDEIWTKIRINPDLLPVGQIELVPGMHYLRFQHVAASTQQAIAVKTDSISDNQDMVRYQIQYKDIPRTITINYDRHFPYQIQGWEETNQSAGSEYSADKLLLTTARRTHSIFLDYWTKNSVADSTYRYILGDL